MNNNNVGEVNTGIVLFSNRKYLFALGTFLINLQKHVSYDCVIVYHDGFTEDEREAIIKVESKVRFIEYGLDEFAKEFSLDENNLKHTFFINRYTVLAVIKFKIFQHLNEFSTVMLFDLDMLLLDDMSDLLEKKYDIAWRNDGQSIRNKLNNWGVKDDLIREIGMYDIYNETMTPNAGFFVVKRTFDYKKTYEECVKYLKNYSFVHPYSIDEVMFGYIKRKMNLNAYDVDIRIYNVFPVHISVKSKLIHFLGDYKPWKKQIVQSIYRDWRINYDRYLDITGKPSEIVGDFSNISDCILKAYFFEKWNKLFHEYGLVYPKDLKLKPELFSPKLSFTYRDVILYNIETNWLMDGFFCTVSVDKNNQNIPVDSIKIKFQELAKDNKEIISFWEDDNCFGLKTPGRNFYDVSEEFNRLYNLTVNARKINTLRFVEITTYHGTKLYVNLDNNYLTHDKNIDGLKVYGCIKGGEMAMFINKTSMPVYLKEIRSDGTVSLTGKQTFFSCTRNNDGSVSIEVEDGRMLSAEKNGKFVLRCWNREWEHFFTQIIGTVAE